MTRSEDLIEAAFDVAADYVQVPARILLILLIAVVVRFVLHRAINRVVRRAVLTPSVPEALRQRFGESSTIAVERRRQRAETVGSVLRSVSSIVVLSIGFVTVLGEFDIELGPIIASAGILGVALGFGAQNLVKDFLTGIFMILEDQYGVGDAVDVGEASGIVEAVGLRTTRLRSVDGTVWHVRNGEILRVGNMSQGFAVAVVDLPLAHSADMEEATELAGTVAAERVARDDLSSDVLDAPEVLGVDKITADSVTLRITVRVSPGRQWAVQRALNAAISDAFDDHAIPRPSVYPGSSAPATESPA